MFTDVSKIALAGSGTVMTALELPFIIAPIDGHAPGL